MDKYGNKPDKTNGRFVILIIILVVARYNCWNAI